ncbi:hypothetical protein AB0D59_31520 [Streptomyces sp. NPDC048417]|uniref:hypothetical protein n=1 Tax=Streptomyces sp. NPDC048417 TaxID=3155387 RepID=UPI003430DEA8
MVAEHPAGNGGLGGEDSGPAVPDAVRRRFLDDTEQAIRASAPREPSAQERAAGVRSRPTGRTAARRCRRATERDSGPNRMGDPVGDLWDPEDPWTATAWRDLDGRGRRRRAGRVLAVVAAIAAVGALAHVPTRSAFPDGRPDEGITQQSEDVLPDGVPTATGPPTGSAYAGTPSPTPRTG